MSDFDKEAERQRLREKYEDDQADREATQRMSQLLLKGATMTNKHCDDCGSPVFRYDDEEFCPECQAGAAAGAADAAEEGADAAADAVADADPDAVRNAEREVRLDDAAGSAAEADAQTADADTPTTDAGTAPGAGQAAESGAGGRPAGSSDGAGGASDAGAGTARTADVGAARASLVRSLTALAERAEAAEDPRRAKELLAAAREAAEAVAALDR
jgi:uncharacterized Zn finger protein (UPF0148 family)